MPAGASRDLADLDGGERAYAMSVELPQSGEGDVVHVHVEAHADRVSGHHVIDFAGLIHGDLGVAGPRRKGAEDDGGPTALPSNALGQLVDPVDRKRDDGASARQSRDVRGAGIREGRKARPIVELDARDKGPDDRTHGVGPEEQRFHEAACVKQAIGEDMPPVGIGAKLDLVDGDEIDRTIERHRFDRANEPARSRRHDLLLAGDQRDPARTLSSHDAVVVFAREQAQREPDHPALVSQHAVDREMGLAGVGRAQNSPYPALGPGHDSVSTGDGEPTRDVIRINPWCRTRGPLQVRLDPIGELALRQRTHLRRGALAVLE